MKEDLLNELLEQCESPIESKLLRNLYPHLTTDRAQELCAQHKVDYYHDMRLTIPDFAFPDMQIAIYCDGFAWRAGNWEKFRRDRFQSRELQLRGWIVLRFAGSEIYRDSEMVVDTIDRAIAQRDGQRAWRDPQQQERQQTPIQQKPPPRKSLPSRASKPEKPTLELHSGQRAWRDLQIPQKPEGGMCGVVFLACVIVGVIVLLDFIF